MGEISLPDLRHINFTTTSNNNCKKQYLPCTQKELLLYGKTQNLFINRKKSPMQCTVDKMMVKTRFERAKEDVFRIYFYHP